MGTGRSQLASAGTQTAGLAIGGNGPLSTVEEFDGSSWTAGGSMPSPRGMENQGGFGTQTAAISVAGQPYTVFTNVYDGSSWTNGPNCSTPRQRMGSAGTSSAGAIFGGSQADDGQINNTEEFTFAIVPTKTITTT